MKICWKWILTLTLPYILEQVARLKKGSAIDAYKIDFQGKNIARLNNILVSMAKISFSVMQHTYNNFFFCVSYSFKQLFENIIAHSRVWDNFR